MSKRKPAVYGKLSPEDPRFTKMKYEPLILRDNRTGNYLFIPRVFENYPGEFAVGAFDSHLENLVETDIESEGFLESWWDREDADRFELVSKTIEAQVYYAFETHCFDEPITNYESEIDLHGDAVNGFLDFCADCRKCRRERIGVRESDDSFIPLKREDGGDFCTAKQQQLCAVLYAMRRIEEKLTGKEVPHENL